MSDYTIDEPVSRADRVGAFAAAFVALGKDQLSNMRWHMRMGRTVLYGANAREYYTKGGVG